MDQITVSKLCLGDVERMLRLQLTISATTPPGFLWPKSERDLALYLDGSVGTAFGVFDGGELRATALLRVPSTQRPNAGTPFPRVPQPDWPAHACFLESTLVLPSSRGRGFQRMLIDARLAYAEQHGMRWVCAGVHLHNARSWNNLLAKGMVIAGMRLDAGYPVLGLLGALHAQRLPMRLSGQIHVKSRHHAPHFSVLQSGYVGARLAPDGSVVYQRVEDDTLV
jgi:GNAT superfamily N-acetyltransferase